MTSESFHFQAVDEKFRAHLYLRLFFALRFGTTFFVALISLVAALLAALTCFSSPDSTASGRPISYESQIAFQRTCVSLSPRDPSLASTSLNRSAMLLYL